MRRASAASARPRRSSRVRSLVERRFGNDRAEQLLVETERARLIGRDRPADLAADLLQALVVDLAELLGADLGMADLGQAGAAEATENVADAPDREADD